MSACDRQKQLRQNVYQYQEWHQYWINVSLSGVYETRSGFMYSDLDVTKPDLDSCIVIWICGKPDLDSCMSSSVLSITVSSSQGRVKVESRSSQVRVKFDSTFSSNVESNVSSSQVPVTFESNFSSNFESNVSSSQVRIKFQLNFRAIEKEIDMPPRK